MCVSVEEAGCVLGQAGRLRLLQTAGYTHQNIGSVLTGLADQAPALLCSPHEVEGWTRIL